MSIPFSIYDFFSFTIPGVLYIFTINYFLKILKLPSFDISHLSNEIGYALLGIVLAYLVGIVMETFAWRWYALFNKDKARQDAFNRLKPNFANIGLALKIEDRRLVLGVMKHHNLALTEYVERFNAISVMFHNVSLGLLLFALVQVGGIIINGISVFSIGLVIAALIFSYVTVKRSRIYDFLYWNGVLEQALHYSKEIAPLIGQSVPRKTKRESK